VPTSYPAVPLSCRGFPPPRPCPPCRRRAPRCPRAACSSCREARCSERGMSRASIFRVKDGATDAIGPRRGLPRRVVMCGASHRSRLRPMRSPESQPLANRKPRPAATYPDTTAPTPLLVTCSLAVLRARARSLARSRRAPPRSLSSPCASAIPTFRLSRASPNLSVRPVLPSAGFPSSLAPR